MTTASKTIKAGQAASRRKDYKTALKLWRPLAEQGNSDAQVCLGFAYFLGHGVEQDYTEAMKWVRKAADQGHPGAQGNVGNFYQHGIGVKQDYTEALNWYHKAADQGDERAQLGLCYLYYQGIGTKQDYAAAYMWGSLAFSLNPRLARLVAEEGESPAFKDLAVKQLTPEQKAAVDKRMEEWLKEHPAPASKP
jgi:TPR repeat protein